MSAALENGGHLIRGEEVPSASGAQFYDVDPATGFPFARFALGAAEDVDRAVSAARAALANLAIIEREGLLERASRIGARMLERLRPAESLAAVAEVRGTGATLGVELVADRDAGSVAAAARELGVIVRASGTKIVMSPPLVIEQDDADRVIDVLAQGLVAL